MEISRERKKTPLHWNSKLPPRLILFQDSPLSSHQAAALRKQKAVFCIDN
jgi:hypothetical protein